MKLLLPQAVILQVALMPGAATSPPRSPRPSHRMKGVRKAHRLHQRPPAVGIRTQCDVGAQCCAYGGQCVAIILRAGGPAEREGSVWDVQCGSVVWTALCLEAQHCNKERPSSSSGLGGLQGMQWDAG
eukprot:1153509-Pelagomonas_calceolata.AAC.14